MAASRRQGALRHPLTSALGSNANVRTLRELVLHGGLLSAPLLVRQTGLAKASVGNALADLSSLRIVESVGLGRAKLYRICSGHPLAPAITALFEAEQARYEEILAEIGRATNCGQVLAVWLYGSASRGVDVAISDVDIAIAVTADAGNAIDKVRRRLARAGSALAFEASVVVIHQEDIIRLNAAADPWWMSLITDALVIRGERPEWYAGAMRDQPRPRKMRAR